MGRLRACLIQEDYRQPDARRFTELRHKSMRRKPRRGTEPAFSGAGAMRVKNLSLRLGLAREPSRCLFDDLGQGAHETVAIKGIPVFFDDAEDPRDSLFLLLAKAPE